MSGTTRRPSSRPRRETWPEPLAIQPAQAPEGQAPAELAPLAMQEVPDPPTPPEGAPQEITMEQLLTAQVVPAVRVSDMATWNVKVPIKRAPRLSFPTEIPDLASCPLCGKIAHLRYEDDREQKFKIECSFNCVQTRAATDYLKLIARWNGRLTVGWHPLPDDLWNYPISQSPCDLWHISRGRMPDMIFDGNFFHSIADPTIRYSIYDFTHYHEKPKPPKGTIKQKRPFSKEEEEI